ncbi:MAG: ABC transporter ATP-binding protein [Deltaproteobacteria bacterium]
MLALNNIHAGYGKIDVLWDISFTVEAGEIVTLVGGNGAGKTTILNTVSGILKPRSGTITFLGQKINGLSPYHIVNLGVCYVPEGGKPFPDMSVRENLEMGAYVQENWRKREATIEEVFEIFPRLRDRRAQLASTLSGGERQMLAMARSLMAHPKLCMFDEPSYGLAPVIVKELFEFIANLHDRGVTILIVEQNIQNALEAADRAYVLENGRVVLEGESAAIAQDAYVKKAYLGL